MSVIHGKPPSVFVVILLLCLSRAVFAIDPEKINKPSEDVESARHHRYVVEGDSLTGLFETSVLQGRTGHRTLHGEEESPVFFKLGGIHPNPFSVPTAIVWVLTQADFQIELISGDEAVVDTFDFVGVENGVYLFPLPDRLPPHVIVTAVLYFGGVEVDRITVPFR